MAIPENQERMTPEELRVKLLEELELVGSQLSSAEGEELRDLLRKEEGIKATLRKIEVEPDSLGDGTIGEASRRMSRGQLP